MAGRIKSVKGIKRSSWHRTRIRRCIVVPNTHTPVTELCSGCPQNTVMRKSRCSLLVSGSRLTSLLDVPTEETRLDAMLSLSVRLVGDPIVTAVNNSRVSFHVLTAVLMEERTSVLGCDTMQIGEA